MDILGVDILGVYDWVCMVRHVMHDTLLSSLLYTPILSCLHPCPLSFQVQKGLIDMENMFDLLATQPLIHDKPRAVALQATHGV